MRGEVTFVPLCPPLSPYLERGCLTGGRSHRRGRTELDLLELALLVPFFQRCDFNACNCSLLEFHKGGWDWTPASPLPADPAQK